MKKLPSKVAAFRRAYSFNASNFLTLTNPKAIKSETVKDAPTAVLHLLPQPRVCSFAGSCAALCLNRAGNPAYLKGKLKARARRTNAFFNDRAAFMQTLLIEVVRFADQNQSAAFRGMRLNGTSDIRWECEPVTVDAELSAYLFAAFQTTVAVGTYRSIFQILPFLNFAVSPYDYTKRTDRDLIAAKEDGYHLTMSWGSSADTLAYALRNGLNIAAPLQGIKRTQALPERLTVAGQSFPVLDGDISDWRIDDNASQTHIVGLRLKRVPGMTQEQIDAFCLV